MVQDLCFTFACPLEIWLTLLGQEQQFGGPPHKQTPLDDDEELQVKKAISLFYIWSVSQSFSSQSARQVKWIAATATTAAVDRLGRALAYGLAFDQFEFSM